MAASTGSTKVDAVVQSIKAETPEKKSGFALYSRFALAGAVCCSVTHGGLTPVDVYVPIASALSASSSIVFGGCCGARFCRGTIEPTWPHISAATIGSNIREAKVH